MNEKQLESIIEQTVAIMKTDDGTINKKKIPLPSGLENTKAYIAAVIRKMRAHNLVIPEVNPYQPSPSLYLSEIGWSNTTFGN